jgi:hypothetical protein
MTRSGAESEWNFFFVGSGEGSVESPDPIYKKGVLRDKREWKESKEANLAR